MTVTCGLSRNAEQAKTGPGDYYPGPSSTISYRNQSVATGSLDSPRS